MGEEARQGILSGRRVERGIVDLVVPVRVRLVHVLEHSHGKAFKRPYVWRAPAHKGRMDAVVAHAALVRLVEAAAILRERARYWV